jgi:hypothetical protein
MEDEVLTVKFSKDERFICSGSEDCKLRITDRSGIII